MQLSGARSSETEDGSEVTENVQKPLGSLKRRDRYVIWDDGRLFR